MTGAKRGIVYLIGAGPGDPGLITLKALEFIKKADVLVYDHLANPKLLSYAPAHVELIYVGKKASDHTLSQEKINQLIAEQASIGQRVVRLKGGDPFIFGRGGEEAEYLASKSVPFEVVPGITSAIAVPAYAGIPLTHRDYTTSVAFITGHESPDKEISTIPWKELAKGPKTLVFLMGVKNLPFICQNLTKYGLAAQTPAAVIQWGTLNRQKSVVGTISDISSKIQRAGLKPPAIIIIGKVIQLRERLNWFEKRPLFGKKIVVTRSRAQASQLVELLEGLGALVIEYPTISIRPIDPNPELYNAIKNIKKYSWIIFTSINGVRCFFHHLELTGLDSRTLGGLKIGAIGPATAEGLTKHGIKADLIPESFSAEGIIEELISKEEIKGKSILIPRAMKARDILPKKLLAEGAYVFVVPVYETLPEEGVKTDELVQCINDEEISMITFTSSSTVSNFLRSLAGKISKDKLKKVDMASIGPITEKTLTEKGLSARVVPKSYTIQALVDSIVEYYYNCNNIKD